MSWDHERVEELLAAHALGGLDAEDAALAERALEEHVPDCERCRRAWDGYREVAADLALAAPAIATAAAAPAIQARALPGRRGRPIVLRILAQRAPGGSTGAAARPMSPDSER